MFNWSNITPDIPRITDVLNTNDTPMNVLRLFTYPWIWFLGGWFIAMIIGAIGAALYIKFDNVMYPAVFFILMAIFFSGVLSAEPAGPIPSAGVFIYIIVLLAAFCIGFLLYQLFVKKG
jgi:hypothetical protein